MKKKLLILLASGVFSTNTLAMSVQFVENKLYVSNQCRDGSYLMAQTFDVRGADLNNLIYATGSLEWPGVNYPPTNFYMEKIKYRDSRNYVVRTTCLKEKFNVKRSARYRFLDTNSGEVSDYIDVVEDKIEPIIGVPDIIDLQ